MSVELRPATRADADFMADVRTEEYPDSPTDRAATRLWLADRTQVWFLSLVRDDERSIGYAVAQHNHWHQSDDRYANLQVGLLPGYRDASRYEAVYSALEPTSLADGAEHLLASARDDDDAHIAALLERGYAEERRERFWELDLVEGADRLRDMGERSRRKMGEMAITIATLAADADPEKYTKLHALSSEGEVDVPSTGTTVPYGFEGFMEWMEAPMIHQDRVWIARAGDRVVGMSMLAYPERGIVSTDWTTLARDHRGQGIARALKLETCLQAISHGIDRVRTDNDFKNAPILHLNEDFGYSHVYDWITFLKPAET